MCKPFLDKHGISNFYYMRISKKGELVFLTNRVDYAMDYWEAGLPTRLGSDEEWKGMQNSTIIWGDWNLDKEIIDFTKATHCYDGFSIVNRYPDCVQGATFFRNHSVDNPSRYYLQRKEEFCCWLKDFEYKHRNLIQHAKENPMILPPKFLLPNKKLFTLRRL